MSYRGSKQTSDERSGHQPLPVNAAGRYAVWVYDRAISPRFAGAPVIIETVRSYEQPDISAVLEGSDIAVELYGGAVTLRLDGLQHRISVERYDWVRYADEQAARAAFVALWQLVERLGSIEDVCAAVRRWREQQG